MLCQSYIEALLADPELADQVQAAYERGSINERCACQAWCLIAVATRLGISVTLEMSRADDRVDIIQMTQRRDADVDQLGIDFCRDRQLQSLFE